MTTSAPESPDIQTLAGISGSVTPEQLLENADLLGRWRLAVQRALATRHLVAVASDLSGRFGWKPSALDALGLEGHFLPAGEIRRHLRAEYDASAEARHPQLLEYASSLAADGYQVIGVPDLRIDPKMDVFRRVNLDFGFCNVLPGLRRGQAAVYHFVSGVRALDADASKRIRRAGVEPVAVSTAEVASALMQLQGGLHCCCGSL